MKITKGALVHGGRIIFGLTLLAFAYGHFTNGVAISAYVPKYFPEGIYWVYLTGACLALAGISFIINRATWAAGIGLAVMLGIFIVTVDIASIPKNPQAMTTILKDLAIAAGALIIAGTDAGCKESCEKISEKKESRKKKK